MNRPSVTKPFLQALNGEIQSRPPFWFMRQAGRYLPEYQKIRKQAKDFLTLCYTPDMATEVTLQPLRRYHMDAAILFSDILVVPDGLGQAVRFEEGRGPVLEPVRSKKEIKNLSLTRMAKHLLPVYETVQRLSRNIPEETALIGFAGAPWTVAVYMIEGHGGGNCPLAKSWAEKEAPEFKILMDLLVEATASHLVEQVKNGAEAVQLFDSWAGVLDGPQIKRWVMDPCAAVVKRFRMSCPDVPVIGFPRAIGDLYEDFVQKTKVNGISLDSAILPEWAAEHLQPHCTVQGNLDNKILVRGGKLMEESTHRILGALSGGPFIFNLGHGILPETPPENVAALVDLIHGWKNG